MKTLLDVDRLVFEPPKPGCILYLPGLPGGNSRIYDRSPYGNHSTITGATWKRLPSGLWCLSFDGSDDYVDCGNLGITGSFTIETWAKMTSLSGGYQAFYAVAGTEIWLGFSPDLNEITLDIGSGTDRAYTIYDLGTTWHHVCVTWDEATGLVYVDGVVQSMTIKGTPHNPLAGIGYLGVHPVSLINDFDGCLALIKIHKGYALSAFEIQNHFNQEKHLFGVW